MQTVADMIEKRTGGMKKINKDLINKACMTLGESVVWAVFDDVSQRYDLKKLRNSSILIVDILKHRLKFMKYGYV